MKPSQYRISVDLDNVFFDTDAEWRRRYAEEFNHGLVPAHLIVWDGPIVDTHFTTYGEWHAWLDDSDFWHSIPVIDGAIDGVRELVDSGYDVWFMTARSGRGAQATREWFHDGESEWTTKITLATDLHDKAALGAHVYIDDRPKTLLQIDQTTEALPICFLQPWNDSCDKWKLDCGDYDPPAPSARVVAARTWDRVVAAVHDEFARLASEDVYAGAAT